MFNIPWGKRGGSPTMSAWVGPEGGYRQL